MSKCIGLVLAVVCLSLLAPLVATAQQQEPDVYTFVAQWAVPRAQWDEFTAAWEKDRPILERMMANGTIISWGSFAGTVHDDSGLTHGMWWQANSIGAIERTREELVKVPPAPGMLAATKHRDLLLRQLIRRARATGPTGGYLWVSSSQVKPGKGQEWRELGDKYGKPLYDELLANGTITFYSVDVEYVHTYDPGLRYVVYITPTADGVDKVRAAIVARNQKRSPEENRAIGDAFAEVTVPGTHRDFFARILAYAQK